MEKKIRSKPTGKQQMNKSKLTIYTCTLSDDEETVLDINKLISHGRGEKIIEFSFK